jgi:hypothetical protein
MHLICTSFRKRSRDLVRILKVYRLFFLHRLGEGEGFAEFLDRQRDAIEWAQGGPF